jgi:hypothetical protein
MRNLTCSPPNLFRPDPETSVHFDREKRKPGFLKKNIIMNVPYYNAGNLFNGVAQVIDQKVRRRIIETRMGMSAPL